MRVSLVIQKTDQAIDIIKNIKIREWRANQGFSFDVFEGCDRVERKGWARCRLQRRGEEQQGFGFGEWNGDRGE